MKTSYSEIEGKQRWFYGLLFLLVYLVLIRTIEWRQLLSSSDLYRQLGVGVALGVGTCGLMLRYARDLAHRYKMFLLLLAVQIGLFATLSFLLGLRFFDMLLLAMLLIEPLAVYLLFRKLFAAERIGCQSSSVQPEAYRE